jgi:hypothetical protein
MSLVKVKKPQWNFNYRFVAQERPSSKVTLLNFLLESGVFLPPPDDGDQRQTAVLALHVCVQPLSVKF